MGSLNSKLVTLSLLHGYCSGVNRWVLGSEMGVSDLPSLPSAYDWEGPKKGIIEVRAEAARAEEREVPPNNPCSV